MKIRCIKELGKIEESVFKCDEKRVSQCGENLTRYSVLV